jgi:hypothetical protein
VAARFMRKSAAVRLQVLRFRIPLGHGCLSVVGGVVYCQIEVSVTGRSPVHRGPKECVCVCVIECD